MNMKVDASKKNEYEGGFYDYASRFDFGTDNGNEEYGYLRGFLSDSDYISQYASGSDSDF